MEDSRNDLLEAVEILGNKTTSIMESDKEIVLDSYRKLMTHFTKTVEGEETNE